MSQLKRKLFVYSGLLAVRRHLRKKPRVLFWHGINERVDAVLCPEVFSVNLFKRQINYLCRHFEIVSIQEFHQRLNDSTFSGKEVLLTFDDGYANNLSVVAPILTAMGIPFTVFVSTDNISSGEFYPTAVNRLVTIASGVEKLSIPTLGKEYILSSIEDRLSASKTISREMKSRSVDEVKSIVNELIGHLRIDEWTRLKEQYDCLRPMNWDEVRQLSRQANVTIGSHCMWHICCHERQSQEIVREQIVSSKQIIEEQLQAPCDFFAYPNGDYTDYSDNCVTSVYRLGFSAETKTTVSVANRGILPRIAAYTPDLSLFKVLVSS